jgi:hypothetical protein
MRFVAYLKTSSVASFRSRSVEWKDKLERILKEADIVINEYWIGTDVEEAFVA